MIQTGSLFVTVEVVEALPWFLLCLPRVPFVFLWQQQLAASKQRDSREGSLWPSSLVAYLVRYIR